MSDPNEAISNIFSEESRKALSNLLLTKGAQIQKDAKKSEKKKAANHIQPDEPISFAQLMVRDGNDALVDELQASLTAAVSGGPGNEKQDPLSSKLNKVRLKITIANLNLPSQD